MWFAHATATSQPPAHMQYKVPGSHREMKRRLCRNGMCVKSDQAYARLLACQRAQHVEAVRFEAGIAAIPAEWNAWCQQNNMQQQIEENGLWGC